MKLVGQLRGVFNTHRTRPLKWRKQQLKALIEMLEKEEAPICEALKKDLHKTRVESMMMEINLIRGDAVLAHNNLEKWANPGQTKKNLVVMFDDLERRPEPYGTTLIIGAWNYPIQLSLLPLVGAIAAGNCAVIKPSEMAVNVAKLLEDIVPRYLDNDCFKVVNGGVPETTGLLKEKWDLIFFTGSSVVGKIVYEAAAKNMTPVILELGGKSPAYVDNSSDMALVANRVLWGKFMNAGQTCVAPDYLMCQPDCRDRLVEQLKIKIKEFFGENPKESDSFGRIININHLKRVKALMDCGKTVVGGDVDENDLYISPTVMVDVKPTDPIMQTEIFGPLMPIMTVRDEDEAISFINGRDKPLAMYIFSKNRTVIDKFRDQTSSGGFCGNDTLMQCAFEMMPLCGVGNSGIGGYHGKFSFDAFSHFKTTMVRQQNMEFLNGMRYPPYTESGLKLQDMFIKKSLKEGSGLMSFFPLIVVGALVAYVLKVVGLGRFTPRFLKD